MALEPSNIRFIYNFKAMQVNLTTRNYSLSVYSHSENASLNYLSMSSFFEYFLIL